MSACVSARAVGRLDPFALTLHVRGVLVLPCAYRLVASVCRSRGGMLSLTGSPRATCTRLERSFALSSTPVRTRVVLERCHRTCRLCCGTGNNHNIHLSFTLTYQIHTLTCTYTCSDNTTTDSTLCSIITSLLHLHQRDLLLLAHVSWFLHLPSLNTRINIRCFRNPFLGVGFALDFHFFCRAFLWNQQ